MRAALPFPAPSSAVPAPAALRARGAHSELALALAVALVPLALYARVFFYPALEVSDEGLSAFARASEALRADGLGALTLYLEGAGSAALPLFSRCVSLGLHAGATLLVFALARRLGAARGASVFGALLFAVHPLRVEAVAWLSQRGVLLGGFCFLLGLFLALPGPGVRGGKAWRSFGSRAAFLLALLADPRLLLGLVGLPLVERRIFARGPSRARILGDLALLCLACAWLLRVPARELAPDPGFLTRLAHAPLALAALGSQWCLPAGLSQHHPHPALSSAPVAPWVLGSSWLVCAVLFLALWRMQHKRPRIALAGLGFVLLGLPQVLFVHDATLFRESAAYVPALGLELLVVSALQAVPPRAARPALALGGLVLFACAFGTAARLRAWRSEPALQESALALAAEPRAHEALGRWHLLHGRLSQAERAYQRALELQPRSARVLLHLGELELRRALIPGQEAHLGRAAQHLEECLAAFPDWSSANELLGEVYQRAQQDERALARLEAAAARTPSGRALTRLGMLRRRLSDQDGARAAFTRATELDPRASDAWCGLGLVQLQADEPDAALRSLERALALEPEHVEARATLARMQELGGERAAAERNLRRALGVNPSFVDGLYALGMLLSSTARADEALRYLDHACELPRGQPHVRAHLESARLRMARGEVAVPRERLRAVLDFNPEQAEALGLLARLGADGTER